MPPDGALKGCLGTGDGARWIIHRLYFELFSLVLLSNKEVVHGKTVNSLFCRLSRARGTRGQKNLLLNFI